MTISYIQKLMCIFALFLGNVRFCRQQMRQVSTHPYIILYEKKFGNDYYFC